LCFGGAPVGALFVYPQMGQMRALFCGGRALAAPGGRT
jgi:hypothetical protein